MRTWNMAGECLQTIPHPGSVWSVAFLPSGDVVSACSDASAYVWSAAPERQAAAGAQAAYDSVIAERAAAANAAPSAGAQPPSAHDYVSPRSPVTLLRGLDHDVSREQCPLGGPTLCDGVQRCCVDVRTRPSGRRTGVFATARRLARPGRAPGQPGLVDRVRIFTGSNGRAAHVAAPCGPASKRSELCRLRCLGRAAVLLTHAPGTCSCPSAVLQAEHSPSLGAPEQAWQHWD